MTACIWDERCHGAMGLGERLKLNLLKEEHSRLGKIIYLNHNLTPSFSVFHKGQNFGSAKTSMDLTCVGPLTGETGQVEGLSHSLPLWPGSQSHSHNTFCSYMFLLFL